MRMGKSNIKQLICLTLGTRPDLSYSVNKLAQYCGGSTERHWRGVKRVLRSLKNTINKMLILGKVPRELDEEIPPYTICGYFDSAYMDDKRDRYSTMGYAFFCAGSLVSWSSKKQQTIALSTTGLAGTEATKEAIWLQQFLKSIGMQKEHLYPARLYGDNQGANTLAHNPEYHSKTKHTHGRQCCITEMVSNKPRLAKCWQTH